MRECVGVWCACACMSCFEPDCFADEVQDRFLCPICQGVMADPVQGPCQHEFGKDCIRQWLAPSSACPVCRLDLRQDGLVQARLMRELVETLPMRCIHQGQGCTARVTLVTRSSHVESECPFVTCRFENCHEVVPRTQKQSHEDACQHNPRGHAVRMASLDKIQRDIQGDIFNNLRVGVFDPLVDVQRRVTKNCVRLRQFEVALDTQSIPRGDEIARGRRKSLIKVLGELEAALEKFDHSIKEFQSNCPRGAGEG